MARPSRASFQLITLRTGHQALTLLAQGLPRSFPIQADKGFDARTWALTTRHSIEAWMAQLGRADGETKVHRVAGPGTRSFS